MRLRPSLPPNAQKVSPSQEEGPSNGREQFFTRDPVEEVTQVARTLADAGGGSVSLELALDLVLNEFVEQARHETGATGAAIALQRDGEIICRATTGNAPELGARVEMASGLSGECLSTGKIQECPDTEQDARVDAVACRQLNVRSMLLVPIAEGNDAFGVLEIFSSEPNSFGDDDARTLQLVAKKIAASKKATEESANLKPLPVELADQLSERLKPITDSMPTGLELGLESISSEQPPKNEFLNSALVVLVIAAALLLGVVIGVRQAVQRGAQLPGISSKNSNSTTTNPAQKNRHSPPDSKGLALTPPPPAGGAIRKAQPPIGGLIVTENGKVIYRGEPSQDTGEPPVSLEKSVTPLVHRVDPQYPEQARSQRIQGPVVLQAQVLSDGTVGNIAVLEGDPVLAEAATQAVKQWKYQPYIVDGRPVERQERITVRFRLPLT